MMDLVLDSLRGFAGSVVILEDCTWAEAVSNLFS